MHRWSKLFIPTLREAPADAEVASHKFLLRSGYIRQLGAGIYNYLFLGQRSLNKIIAIVREEMDKIGQEFYLPGLLPKEPWEESGRWTGMGDNMFRLKDRKGADLCLGMTHEEIMTTIARSELRSYKQLPQIWYQIQTKFRDEPRPKSGLLRVRQFIMKDAYSFDIDKAGLDKSFDLHDAVYRTHLHALRAEVRRRRGRFRLHGRLAVAGVHGLHRRRRGPDRKLPGLRLRGESGEGDFAARAGRRDGADRRRQAGAGSHARLRRHRRCGRVLQDFAGLRHQVRGLHGAEARRATRRQARTPGTAWRPSCAAITRSTRPSCWAQSARPNCAPCRPRSLQQFFNGPAGFLGPVGLKPRRASRSATA